MIETFIFSINNNVKITLGPKKNNLCVTIKYKSTKINYFSILHYTYIIILILLSETIRAKLC